MQGSTVFKLALLTCSATTLVSFAAESAALFARAWTWVRRIVEIL